MFKKMILPDKTRMGDGNIVCKGDILIGNYSEIGYGLIGENVFVGERTDIEGEIEARKDLRVGAFSTVNGDVYAEGDVYLAERVKICGKLILLGNLDIGDDVKIDGGFESRGWIVIRNPPPIVVFIILYLMTLLKLGRGEEFEKILDELSEDDAGDTLKRIFICPASTFMDAQKLSVKTPIEIGEACNIIGSIKADDIKIKKETTILGGIESNNDVEIAKNSEIHGDVHARGRVTLDRDVSILGKIRAKEIVIRDHD